MTATASRIHPPADEILHGRDGWLFLAGGDDAPLALYAADSSFTVEHERRWRNRLAERAARFSADGVQYLHLVVPDKLSLFGHLLDDPSVLAEAGPLERLAACPSGLPRPLVDVLPYLDRQRDRYALFWKSGNRWTPWACFMAYQSLCARLGVTPNGLLLGYRHEEEERTLSLGARVDPPRTESARRYRFVRHSRRRHANALVELRDAIGRDDDRRLDAGSQVVFENDSPDAVQRCVVLFGEACSDVERHLLGGMLAETFREVHVIWSEGIDDGYIARVRPDIVLTQGVERRMTTVPEDGVDFRTLAETSLAGLRRRFADPDAPAECRDEEPDRNAEGRGRLESLLASVSARRRHAPSTVRTDTLLAAETYRLDPPSTVQEGCASEFADSFMRTNEVTLVDVERAAVFFTGGSWSITTADGREVLAYGIDDAQAGRGRWRRRRSLGGTSLLFATSAGAHSYYHWMLEILPKLGLLERHGIDLGSIDHFLVREIYGDWQLETLSRFGIDRRRIVETRTTPHLDCERVLHVDLPCGINLKMNRFVPMWMQHFHPRPVGQGGDRLRIYISRPDGVRRGVANEPELLPLLAAADIEPVLMEGRSLQEQATLLSRADVVVAPHGAALTNIVFCRPGSEVVELFSRHVYPYFYGLAASCGHVYHAVLENPVEDYPRLVSHRIAQSHASNEQQWATAKLSFAVPPDAFARTLERLRPATTRPVRAESATR